ncbi:MAG: hypothetical protein HKN75_11370 [Bacteroidia bacterium]|nr:hypothetical protein [Bacteroidia bacterium]
MQTFNKLKYSLLILLLIAISTSSYAQIPQTDIYMLDIVVKNNKAKFINPVKVTDNPGYDNQPYFSQDGKYLYYTAIADKEQADIFRVDLETMKTQQVTRTKESEYSPTPIQGSTAITTVRVDQDSTQRLYQLYPFSRKPPEMLLTSVDDIGYHCWLNENHVAMFRLEETFNLHIGNKDNNRLYKIDTNIGRCLQRVPNSNDLSYVSKTDTSNWVIKRYDLRTKENVEIGPVYNQNEDFAWLNIRQIIMADNGSLYCFDIHKKKWKKVKGFKEDLGNFYRIHFNADRTKMAVVTFTGDKP